MRILYVTAHYPPDFVSGATLQVRRMAEHVAASGHEVAVLSGAIVAGLADGERRREDGGGVRVEWIGTAERIDQDVDANWQNPLATLAAADLLDEWRPDVVHAHALQTLGAGPIAAAADRSIPTVVTMHDLWWWCSRLFLVDRDLRPCPLDTGMSDCACARTAEWRRARAAELALTLARVDEVLAPSAALRDVAVANGVDPTRIAVDTNDVDPAASSAPVPAAPMAEGPVRFLYVGGDHPLKGVDVVLAAARRVRPRRGWRLAVYGVAKRRVGLGVPVDFRPAYAPADTATVMRAADVLVIPSIARESFSLAAREALAAGLAVITSDCLGPEEVVDHDDNGLVVPTGDVAALARAMSAVAADRSLLLRLRRAAIDRPIELRTPAEHADALVARYRRLAGT
ncbi:MAG: glycosyltransferase [Acidimicrobiia bacterium]|nr:glycosyltransferase [Acidimicrobiia bacterium]